MSVYVTTYAVVGYKTIIKYIVYQYMKQSMLSMLVCISLHFGVCVLQTFHVIFIMEHALAIAAVLLSKLGKCHNLPLPSIDNCTVVMLHLCSQLFFVCVCECLVMNTSRFPKHLR